MWDEKRAVGNFDMIETESLQSEILGQTITSRSIVLMLAIWIAYVAASITIFKLVSNRETFEFDIWSIPNILFLLSLILISYISTAGILIYGMKGVAFAGFAFLVVMAIVSVPDEKKEESNKE